MNKGYLIRYAVEVFRHTLGKVAVSPHVDIASWGKVKLQHYRLRKVARKRAGLNVSRRRVQGCSPLLTETLRRGQREGHGNGGCLDVLFLSQSARRLKVVAAKKLRLIADVCVSVPHGFHQTHDDQHGCVIVLIICFERQCWVL